MYDYFGNKFTGKKYWTLKGKKYQRADCSRCNGSGMYSSFHGVCWKCGGSGKHEVVARYDLRLYETEKEILEVIKVRNEKEEKRKEKNRIEYEKNLPLIKAKATISFLLDILNQTIKLSKISKPLNEQKFYDGDKGKKYNFIATVEKRIELETQWGSSILFIFKTDAGEILSMFYTGYKFECYENDKIEFTATIKDFEIYKNRNTDIQTKQTILSRPKLIIRKVK